VCHFCRRRSCQPHLSRTRKRLVMNMWSAVAKLDLSALCKGLPLLPNPASLQNDQRSPYCPLHLILREHLAAKANQTTTVIPSGVRVARNPSSLHLPRSSKSAPSVALNSLSMRFLGGL
jgi:hypothetical protein